MSNRVNLISGLIIRSERILHSARGDKRQGNKLINQFSNSFAELMKEKDEAIFEEDFNALISSNAANSYMVSNFFPINMDEYGRYRVVTKFTNDLCMEIRWIAYCLKFYREEISNFVKAREEYDNCILLSKYEEALVILQEIENKFGVSLWSMECKFFLYPQIGLDTKDLIDTIPETIFGAVMNFYELKNRENVTSSEYFYIAKKEANVVKKLIPNDTDIIEFYRYKITSFDYEGEPDNILQILSIMQRASLIDKYLFFIDVCDCAVNKSEENIIVEVVKKYIALVEEIEDDHLIALRFVLDYDRREKKNYARKARLDKAKAEFISGDLVKAREESIELLGDFPNNIGAMNLFVEANILIGDGFKAYENTNLGDLLKHLVSVYTLTEDRDDCMELINKLANSCSQSTWARPLLNNIIHQRQGYEEKNYRNIETLANIQHLDIETVMASLTPEECIKFIDENMDGDNLYIKFRRALLCNDYGEAKKLCKVEAINDLLVVCDDRNEIDKKMKHLRPIKGSDAYMAIRAMKNFLSTVDLDQHLELVLKISVDLIMDNIFTALFIPLKKIVECIDNSGRKIRANIGAPILYYVYANYFAQEKRDDLGIICEDFFLFRGIEKPTELDVDCDDYSRKELVYFLKNVCSGNVMDISISAFSNSRERDIERVEICNVLSQIDLDNVKEYENEIREVTQKLMINAELKTIEGNRIHVNVDGIKDRLEKSHKNDFMRYRFYQDERHLHWTMAFDDGSAEKFRRIHDAPERILQELIYAIRDAFVSSDEYGLNGYLSLNIRHGTLEDELRSFLYQSFLNAKKDANSGEYIINSHWIDGAGKGDLDIMRQAIIDFHKKTEEIIAKLKGEYIQISTEEKVTNGKFNYILDDVDMLTISIGIRDDMTFEEFLDFVINHLWGITERNLIVIQNVIRGEIVQDYNKAYEELKVAIANMQDKKQLRELQQKIAESSTDMANKLDKVCHWFQRSKESKHNDFDLQFAFKLGLQTIKNMHPEKRFIAKEIEAVESDKILGMHLKSFDGIFYNLFDNIYKKAESSDGVDVEIRYSLSYKKGKFYIYIENDFDCTKDISKDEEKVKEAKGLVSSGEYLKKVKGEGGTGIPKIVKIIEYDLGRKPEIDFGYEATENKFFMKIEF